MLHLTILTGHERLSPRSEVADHVISGLQVIIAQGGGAVGNTGWGVPIVERSAAGAVFDLSHQGVEVARYFLAIIAASEQRLWEQASAYRSCRACGRPSRRRCRGAGLLPDGMALLADDPELMLELGDFGRCVAWALLS